MRRVYMLMAIIGFLVLVCAGAVFARLDIFGRLLADRILANAAIPTEAMPPTSGQVPFSSADVQVVGGRGEGLSCSLPATLADLAFPPEDGRAPIGLQMRQACASHDYCYRHGAATYAYTQADCDFLLQEHAFRLCYFIERPHPGSDKEVIEAKQKKCRRDARLVTLGVRAGGSDSFRPSNPDADATQESASQETGLDERASTYFEYDPYPVRSASYVVYRIADAPDPEGRLNGLKALYKFAMRQSGMFVEVAAFGGTEPAKFALRAKIPGDPSYLVNAPIVVATTHNDRPEDWFVWWQRRGLNETGGRILAIAAARATDDDWKCLYEAGMSDEMLGAKAPCASRNAIAVAEVGLNGSDDAGFSQVIAAHGINPPPDTLHLMALQTNACLSKGANVPCFRDILVSTAFRRKQQPQAPLRLTDLRPAALIGQKQDEYNVYRNYVASPVVFQPPLERDPLLTWVRRDEDYQTKAFLRRIGIARKTARPHSDAGWPRGSLWLADIEELDEPLFALGRTGESQALVALRRTGPAGADRVDVRQWRMPALRNDDTGDLPSIEANMSVCNPHFDGTWLARPPIAIAVRSGETLVVLSRAVKAKGPQGDYALELAAFKFDKDGGCAPTLPGGKSIPTAELIASVTDDDEGHFLPTDQQASWKEKQKQRHPDLIRQTPILVDDLDGDGTLEIVFPGAGHAQTPKLIARINGDGTFLPSPDLSQTTLKK
ncbi:hypothetical protein [Ensifer sp.]|jgi:hypothetical protein|uniref:hypothetical protein n=1 Tax=Ensifer sp. TaxID=1872086 RepID=UPI002E1308BA|nr:hypothetical protein [Ensifer sp.]